MVGGVAGAVDSGGAAEGVDLEPGIICEAGQTAGLPQRLRFEKRVLTASGTCFFNVEAREPHVCWTQHPVAWPEYLRSLAKLSGIAGCKYQIHIAKN